MLERGTLSNEIIGLTIMLLMVLALVASQAGSTAQDGIGAAAAQQQIDSREPSEQPFTATIQGHINGKVLTISVDTLSHFGLFRLERDSI